MTTPVRVHRVVSGPPDAPVLVLANGLGSTIDIWDPQAAALATTLRVVRYDLRGHGGTPAPSGPYSIADLAADLVALLDDLGVERAHLGGLSLGGMIAMSVAAHDPERVDRLLLVATSARMGPPEQWASRAALVLEQGMEAVADAVVGRWFTPEWAAAHPDVVDRMRAGVRAVSPVGYAGCCRAIETMDQTADLPAITAPTLVVVGADDPATPPDHAYRIAAGIAGSRVAIVPDAAHAPTLQQPDAVTRLFREHLGIAQPEGSNA